MRQLISRQFPAIPFLKESLKLVVVAHRDEGQCPSSTLLRDELWTIRFKSVGDFLQPLRVLLAIVKVGRHSRCVASTTSQHCSRMPHSKRASDDWRKHRLSFIDLGFWRTNGASW
jgi:hypothetical protein